MKGIELHSNPDGGATALTASGVHRLDRDAVADLFALLTIRPTERNLRAWLAERPRAIATLLCPEYSQKPHAHTWPGCRVCDHKQRDQIEAEIDSHRSRRSIAARYGVPVGDVRVHRRRGKHRA